MHARTRRRVQAVALDGIVDEAPVVRAQTGEHRQRSFEEIGGEPDRRATVWSELKCKDAGMQASEAPQPVTVCKYQMPGRLAVYVVEQCGTNRAKQVAQQSLAGVQITGGRQVLVENDGEHAFGQLDAIGYLATIGREQHDRLLRAKNPQRTAKVESHLLGATGGEERQRNPHARRTIGCRMPGQQGKDVGQCALVLVIRAKRHPAFRPHR